MNAPLAATLFCLCNLACAAPKAQAAESPPGTAEATAVTHPRAPQPARVATSGGTADAARSGARAQPATPERPSPEHERGLLLAGLALMAGIALRRLGDASP